ncbi:MAG: hypothetical protein WC815_04040 [Vicinamibacterales bacterium]
MEYKVVPFKASIGNTDNSGAAASQLENLIREQASGGWDYLRLEHVDTYVAGTSGCFGFGATPGANTSIAMAVFRK